MKGLCFTRCRCDRFAVIILAAGLLVAAPQASLAQIFRRCDPCVPCPTTPSTGAAPSTTGPAQPETGTQPGTGAAQTAPGAGGTTQPNPTADLFAEAGIGAAGGAASAAPNMIGDFFGSSSLITVSFGHGAIGSAPLPGGAVPTFKLAEDTSPMPQDRVFFNYDYYHDVPINPAANPNIGVNAYTPGFEKTFLGGMMSFEMRVPMATTLDNNVFFDGTTSTSDGEIGNLSMALKCLLYQGDAFALSGGLAMTVPTAKGSQYSLSSGTGTFATTPFMTIANQSVHLMPFFGALWTPNDRLFAIGYVQVDVDANGDSVNFGGTAGGKFREQTMLYLDASLGYWVCRSECSKELVTGFAPILELHMNQSLDSSSTVNEGIVSVAGVSDTFSDLDLTVGGVVELHKNTTLTAGYCTPLTSQREFDGQFRLMMNYRF